MKRHIIQERLRAMVVGNRGDHDLNPDFPPPPTPLMQAAVLVPLVERPDGLTVLLTRRTAHLKAHAGQISFPGGKMEPGDADSVATALRETEEEVGLRKGMIDVAGRLDRYVTRTGFDITPVVGFVSPQYQPKPDPYEVDEVFEVPLRFLVDPANHRRDSRQFEGRTRYFYAMTFDGYYIWGATAGIIVNLASLLGPSSE